MVVSIEPEKYDAWAAQRKLHFESLNAALIYPALIQGDRSALASAITLIESTNPTHRKEAHQLLTLCMPHAGKSWRIGITGVPGVGKSTFIERIGKKLIDQGHKLAVMAIDPSSQISGGSILGDKTRMDSLSQREEVFIRPSATGKTLGGVAQHTRETILLCEAAGYDVILIETVGVGQSETVVHSMVDFFLLLMLAGAGDELQGIKRGIMEMADGILITKADQGNEQGAKLAKRTLENALHLFAKKESQWNPKVECISSLENKAMDHPLTWWKEYFEHVTKSGFLELLRKEQDLKFFEESFHENLISYIQQNSPFSAAYDNLRLKVMEGKYAPHQAAEELISLLTQTYGEH
jgi:LAO/AO transport system kinase